MDETEVTVYLPIAPDLHPMNIRQLLDMSLLKLEEALIYSEEAELNALDEFDYNLAEAYEEINRRIITEIIRRQHGSATHSNS